MCAFDQVGQGNGLERKEIKQNEENMSENSVLSGPPHPQKDMVCASEKVGQSNSVERKEIKQNEGDKSVNSVLSEPPHPLKETASNYNQRDHSNGLERKENRKNRFEPIDSETLLCHSVTVPSNVEIVSSREVNGPEKAPDKAENTGESRKGSEWQICKKLRVVHTNVNGWTTRNVGHELRCIVLGSYDADLICVNETHLKPGKEISMPGYKFVNHPCTQREILGYKGHGGIGILVKDDVCNWYKVSMVYKEYKGIY